MATADEVVSTQTPFSDADMKRLALERDSDMEALGLKAPAQNSWRQRLARVLERDGLKSLTPAQRFCYQNGIPAGTPAYESIMRDLSGNRAVDDRIEWASNTLADNYVYLTENVWVPYFGPEGGRGAKNVITQDVIYGTWAERVLRREADRVAGKPDEPLEAPAPPKGQHPRAHFAAILAKASQEDLDALLVRREKQYGRPLASHLTAQEFDFIRDTLHYRRVADHDHWEKQEQDLAAPEQAPDKVRQGIQDRVKSYLAAAKARKEQAREEHMVREAGKAAVGFPGTEHKAGEHGLPHSEPNPAYHDEAPPAPEDDLDGKPTEQPNTLYHDDPYDRKVLSANAFCTANGIEFASDLHLAVLRDLTGNKWIPWGKGAATKTEAKDTMTGKIVTGGIAMHVLSGPAEEEGPADDLRPDSASPSPTPSPEAYEKARRQTQGRQVKRAFEAEGYELLPNPFKAGDPKEKRIKGAPVVHPSSPAQLQQQLNEQAKANAAVVRMWTPGTPPYDDVGAFRPPQGHGQDYMEAVMAMPLIKEKEAQLATQKDWAESTGKGKVLDHWPDGLPRHYDYTPQHKVNQRRLVNRIIRATEADMLDQFGVGTTVHQGEGKPKAFFVLGTAGAGKSSYVTADIVDELGNEGAVNCGSDVVKEFRKKDGYEGWNAEAYHPESRDVAKLLIAQCMAENRNIIVERIGDKPEEAVAQIAEMVQSGYDVHVRFADVPIERSLQSVIDRMFREEKAKGRGKGRYVPLRKVWMTRNGGDSPGPAATYEELKKAPNGIASFKRYNTDIEWVKDPSDPAGRKGHPAYPAVVTDTFIPTEKASETTA